MLCGGGVCGIKYDEVASIRLIEVFVWIFILHVFDDIESIES